MNIQIRTVQSYIFTKTIFILFIYLLCCLPQVRAAEISQQQKSEKIIEEEASKDKRVSQNIEAIGLGTSSLAGGIVGTAISIGSVYLPSLFFRPGTNVEPDTAMALYTITTITAILAPIIFSGAAVLITMSFLSPNGFSGYWKRFAGWGIGIFSGFVVTGFSTVVLLALLYTVFAFDNNSSQYDGMALGILGTLVIALVVGFGTTLGIPIFGGLGASAAALIFADADRGVE